MSEGPQGPGRAAFHQKSAEIAVAALFLFLGALVVYDSVRLGAKWGDDGPQSGYFPFYIGLLVCVSAIVNLTTAIVARRNKVFVQVDQLKLVLAVLVPSAVYVALIGWIGIYVASVLFVGFFMRW